MRVLALAGAPVSRREAGQRDSHVGGAGRWRQGGPTAAGHVEPDHAVRPVGRCGFRQVVDHRMRVGTGSGWLVRDERHGHQWAGSAEGAGQVPAEPEVRFVAPVREQVHLLPDVGRHAERDLQVTFDGFQVAQVSGALPRVHLQTRQDVRRRRKPQGPLPVGPVLGLEPLPLVSGDGRGAVQEPAGPGAASAVQLGGPPDQRAAGEGRDDQEADPHGAVVCALDCVLDEQRAGCGGDDRSGGQAQSGRPYPVRGTQRALHPWSLGGR